MAEIAEPPPQTDTIFVPPQVPESKEPSKAPAGGKGRWQAELDKLTPTKAEEQDTKKDVPTTHIEEKSEPPAVSEGDKPETKEEKKSLPVQAKPESPLDTLLSETPKKAVEPDPVEEFDDKNPDWKRARQLMRTQRDEKKALETSIAELKKAPKADPEQITKLSQERDALKQSLAEREELIKSVDVRLSEDYRVLAKKRDDTVQKIGDRVKSYGVDPAAFISALSLPEGRYKNEQIEALMTDVAPSYQAKINVLVEKLEEHNEAIGEFEKDAPKKYEEIQAKRDVAMREQQEATIKNIQSQFSKFVDDLPNKLITARIVPDDVPGGTEWNQDIRNATEKANRVLTPGGADFEETSDVAWKGSHYDALLARYLILHDRDKENTKRLAEFDSGGPDFKGGEKPKGEPKLTPSQKFHKVMEQGRAAQDD